MLRVPTVRTHSWKRIQRETVTLVGPMTLKESLQIKNNRLSTPVTVSGIHSHSKTSKCMIMYNLPLSRGTMTRTLTLQVIRNRQHDTSRPSVQPNHQDYVSQHLVLEPKDAIPVCWRLGSNTRWRTTRAATVELGPLIP